MSVCEPPWAGARRPRDLSDAVGCIGLDAPLELIEACGLEPLPIYADPAAPGPAADAFSEGRGQPLLHALAAELIALADAGLRRVVIGGAPTSNLYLYGFLQGLRRLGSAPALDVQLAEVIHLDTPSARAFNLQALHRLAEALGGAPPAERLDVAVQARNRLRAALRSVEQQRVGPGASLSGARALALHAEALAGPADQAAARLELALTGGAEGAAPARPLLFSGQPATAWRAYPVLEAHGWRVAGEDCDLGSRAIGPDVATGVAPLEAVAERYRRRTPTSDGWSSEDAAAALLDQARATGARAVVFDVAAFDHPAAWDFPAKRAALEAAGVACVLLPPYAYRDPESAALEAVAVLATLQSSPEAAHG